MPNSWRLWYRRAKEHSGATTEEWLTCDQAEDASSCGVAVPDHASGPSRDFSSEQWSPGEAERLGGRVPPQ